MAQDLIDPIRMVRMAMCQTDADKAHPSSTKQINHCGGVIGGVDQQRLTLIMHNIPLYHPRPRPGRRRPRPPRWAAARAARARRVRGPLPPRGRRPPRAPRAAPSGRAAARRAHGATLVTVTGGHLDALRFVDGQRAALLGGLQRAFMLRAIADGVVYARPQPRIAGRPTGFFRVRYADVKAALDAP